MLTEAVDLLNCRPGKIYVDGTLGGAGHARAICEKIAPDGLLIGIDQDKDSIINAEKVLKPFSTGIRLFHDNFINLPDILERLNIASVDGIILDLGISLHHLESSGRGFSFKRDEPLDMRMNTSLETTAEYLINTLKEKQLQDIFQKYGEERWSPRIARRIVQMRRKEKIASSMQLAQLVSETVPRKGHARQRIHPATRVFMALRIAVNEELDRLRTFLSQVIDLLGSGGRLCVLSFHSLEDRIVKNWARQLEKGCTCPSDFPKCICGKKGRIRILTKKPMRPTDQETASNPMARSTRLRAVEKL
jgi:16S rRNA (cytosine1402-N4)-methyltransferase